MPLTQRPQLACKTSASLWLPTMHLLTLSGAFTNVNDNQGIFAGADRWLLSEGAGQATKVTAVQTASQLGALCQWQGGTAFYLLQVSKSSKYIF